MGSSSHGFNPTERCCRIDPNANTPASTLELNSPVAGSAGTIVGDANETLNPALNETASTENFRLVTNCNTTPLRIEITRITNGGGNYTISANGGFINQPGASDYNVAIIPLPDVFGNTPQPLSWGMRAGGVSGAEPITFIASHPVTSYVQGAAGTNISTLLPYTGNWSNNNNANIGGAFGFDPSPTLEWIDRGANNINKVLVPFSLNVPEDIFYSPCELPGLLERDPLVIEPHPEAGYAFCTEANEVVNPSLLADTFSIHADGTYRFDYSAESITGGAQPSAGLIIEDSQGTIIFQHDTAAGTQGERISPALLSSFIEIDLVGGEQYTVTRFAGGGSTASNFEVSAAEVELANYIDKAIPDMSGTTVREIVNATVIDQNVNDNDVVDVTTNLVQGSWVDNGDSSYTCTEAADYVLVNAMVTQAGGVQRAAPLLNLEINGVQVATSATGYIRSQQGHNVSSNMIVYRAINVNAGDVFRLSSGIEAVGGVVNSFRGHFDLEAVRTI